MTQDSAPLPDPSPPPKGLFRRLVVSARAAVATPVEAASRSLIDSARVMGRSAIAIGSFVLVGLVGYGMVMLGVTRLLAPWLGPTGSLFTLGGIHVAVGVVGVFVYARRPPTPPAPPVPTAPPVS